MYLATIDAAMSTGIDDVTTFWGTVKVLLIGVAVFMIALRYLLKAKPKG